jgi:hypothetical protein
MKTEKEMSAPRLPEIADKSLRQVVQGLPLGIDNGI